MKSIRILSVLALVGFLSAGSVRAADDNKGGCCASADKKSEKCTHECCEAAAKEHKNCEKCGGKNEAKK